MALAFMFFASWPLLAWEPTETHARKGEVPELGARTERSVGEVLYSKFDYFETAGILLDDTFVGKLLARKLFIPAGSFLWSTEHKGVKAFCTNRETVAGLWDTGEYVCFRDTDRDQKLDLMHITSTAFGNWSKVKGPPIPFHAGTDLEATRGRRFDLLYEGVAAGVLRLSYREYSDNLARPAFMQELTYTLEAGGATDVVFRGARLRVESASNEGISYEVVSGLRE
jgi:hypothetical protein